MTSIRAQGFASPTPIQCQAWPMALSGRDVVAIAQTGSGKTIAFALPAMLHINAFVTVFLSILRGSRSHLQSTSTLSWRWAYRTCSCTYP
jgi:superfamily II DNA/RNA helicase